MEKVGDWDKVHKLMNNLDKNLKKAQQIALMRWGLLAERIATQHIASQDLGWTPLDSKTLSKKVAQGYSENILVQSSTYFRNITSYVEGDTAYAGVKREVSYSNGVDVANIAAVHEFGTEHIPERPLWQPTLKEVQEAIGSDKRLNPATIFFNLLSV